MQISPAAIKKLATRAYCFAIARVGQSAVAEDLVLNSLKSAISQVADPRAAKDLEHHFFSLLQEKTVAGPKSDPFCATELAFTHQMQEPGRSYFMLRYFGGLTPEMAGAIAQIAPDRVADTENQSLAEAAELLGLTSVDVVSTALAEKCRSILPPAAFQTAVEEIAQVAVLQKPRRGVAKLAVLATMMSSLIVLFIGGTKVVERMQRFPGYDKVATLLCASEHPGAARERSPMNGNVSALEDWFIINHGGESLAVPPHLSAIAVKACRVFQHGSAQILEAELRDKDIFLYLFRGEEVGAELPPSVKPHFVAKDGWAGLVQADAAGNFALLATKGSRAAIDALISKHRP